MNKENVLETLKAENLSKLYKLVDEDIINYDDMILRSPMCYSAEMHLELKEDKEYLERVKSESANMVKLFKYFYPEIQIGDVVFRQKSAKSVIGKIKNLEIERVSKLIVEEIRNPELIELYKKEQIRRIYTRQDKSKAENNIEIDRYIYEDLNKKEILKGLLFERIDENIIKKEDKDNSEEKNEVKQCIIDLLDKSKTIDIEKTEQRLLDDSRLSHSTRTAAARLLYSRLIEDKEKQDGVEYLETDIEGISRLKKLTSKEIQDKIGFLQENYGYDLKFESIERLEEPTEWDNPKYDGNYRNRIERLIDTKEFLRVKDFYGMHIVIMNIPDDFESHNTGFMNKLDMRNYLRNIGDTEFKDYDQDCMDIISKDYMNLLAENGVTKEFFMKNPKLAKEFIYKKQNTKIIPDSLKNHDKKNGYRAKHIKFQLGEPRYTLELQVISKYVAGKSKGMGSASHAHRFGKKRIIPDLLRNEEYDLDKLNQSQIDRVKDELEFITPDYYQLGFREDIDNNIECYVKEKDLYENCEKFYEDLNDPINKDKEELTAFNRMIYFTHENGRENQSIKVINNETNKEQNKEINKVIKNEKEDDFYEK